VEDFKFGKANRIKKEQIFPGGKGVHVALGIAELGEECALLGFWGGDSGKYVKEYCEKKGIRCYGPDVDEPGRTCFTFRSEGDLDGTELLGPGPAIDEKESYLFWMEFIKLLDNASAVSMSGSWPANTTMDYTGFIIATKKKGIKTFVDCSGKNLKAAITAKPYCVHINQHEGFEIFQEQAPKKMGLALLKGCDLAAVTAGSDGLYLVNKDQSIIHANCKLENIISPVGSGDCLMSGLIVAENQNLSLAETAKLAVACGAANCIREDLGMFYKKDVETLRTHISLTTADYMPSFNNET